MLTPYSHQLQKGQKQLATDWGTEQATSGDPVTPGFRLTKILVLPQKLHAHIGISSFCKCIISGSPSSLDQGIEEWKINQAMQNVLDTAITSFPSHKKLSHCIYQTCHWNKKKGFNILWHLQPRLFNIYSHHRHLYRNFSYKLNSEVQMQPLPDFF